MTLEQIFYWFCKKEKVFTLVKQLVNIRISYWNKEHGKIISIVNPFIVNTNERNNVKIYSIYKVNNETPNISWYIKRNRETYGLD